MALTRRALLAGLPALVALGARTTSAQIALAPARDRWFGEYAMRRADVPPYRTQLDGSRYASSNCGPATLGMVLGTYGMDIDTLELRRLTHTYQGTWPGRGGTALHHVARVAEDFHIPIRGLYDVPDGEFHRWTVDEVAAQLSRRRVVMPLVRFDYLPGHESSGVRWGHYLLLYGVRGDGFLYHDSAYRPVAQGAGRWIGRAQLNRAMTPVLVPRQAVAFGA